MARTVWNELFMDLGTFEMEGIRLGVWDALQSVFERLRRRRKDSDLDPEYEYAWMMASSTLEDSIGLLPWSSRSKIGKLRVPNVFRSGSTVS